MLEDEVFSNSPQVSGIGMNSVSATPLAEKQTVLRHQKIAEERKIRLLEAQSDLELAVCQNDILTQENTKLRHDVDRLKHQLEDTKSKLFLNPDLDDESEDEVAKLKAHNLKLRYRY